MGLVYNSNLLVEFTSQVYGLSFSAKVMSSNYESSFTIRIGWSS